MLVPQVLSALQHLPWDKVKLSPRCSPRADMDFLQICCLALFQKKRLWWAHPGHHGCGTQDQSWPQDRSKKHFLKFSVLSRNRLHFYSLIFISFYSQHKRDMPSMPPHPNLSHTDVTLGVWYWGSRYSWGAVSATFREPFFNMWSTLWHGF